MEIKTDTFSGFYNLQIGDNVKTFAGTLLQNVAKQCGCDFIEMMSYLAIFNKYEFINTNGVKITISKHEFTVDLKFDSDIMKMMPQGGK